MECNKSINVRGNKEGLITRETSIIDDLGAEPNPVQYMGNKVDLLSDILETREDNGCITLITSNLPPDYLSNTYNDRLESRMMALNYYELNGDDKRCQ